MIVYVPGRPRGPPHTPGWSTRLQEASRCRHRQVGG